MAKSSGFKFAVNTNALRNSLKPAEIAVLVKKAGYHGIEWGLPSLDDSPACIKEMGQVAQDQGLEIPAYINAGQLWKTDVIRKWSDMVAAVGGKKLRVGQPWVSFGFDQSVHQRDSFNTLYKLMRDGMEKLVPLYKEYGIQYVVEIHMGGVATSAATAWTLAQGLDPAAVGFIYDPANTICEGFFRPRSSVEMLGRHLSYVHVKNLVLEEDNTQPDPTPTVARKRFRWKSVGLTEGMLDWAEVMFALKVTGWNGWLSMEEFSIKKPLEELTARRRFIEDCIAAVPGQSSPPYAQNND